MAERPGRPHEPAVSFVYLGMLRQRIAGVQVERHVELFLNFPEWPILFLVVVGDGVGVTHLRKPVGECADHAEILDAALQLSGGEIGVLQRQCGDCLKAIGLLAYGVGKVIVSLACHVVRLLCIGDGLDRRRIKRKDHHLDPEFVHQANASPVNIENALAHFRPDIVRKKSLRIHQCVIDGEVFLKRDLALHDFPRQN